VQQIEVRSADAVREVLGARDQSIGGRAEPTAQRLNLISEAIGVPIRRRQFLAGD